MAKIRLGLHRPELLGVRCLGFSAKLLAGPLTGTANLLGKVHIVDLT